MDEKIKSNGFVGQGYFDLGLCKDLTQLKDKGLTGAQLAEIIYNSCQKALNITSIGPDNVDYSGVYFYSVLSALRRILECK